MVKIKKDCEKTVDEIKKWSFVSTSELDSYQ